MSPQEDAARKFREAMRRALEIACPRCRAGTDEQCFDRNGAARKPHARRAHMLIRAGEVT